MKFCCTFLNKEFFPQNCPRIVWEEFTTRIQNADLQTIIFRSSRPMNITIAKSLPATSHNYTIHFPNTTYTKITNTEPRLHDNAGGPCCCTYLSKILRFPIEAPEELLYFCMSNPCPRANPSWTSFCLVLRISHMFFHTALLRPLLHPNKTVTTQHQQHARRPRQHEKIAKKMYKLAMRLKQYSNTDVPCTTIYNPPLLVTTFFSERTSWGLPSSPNERSIRNCGSFVRRRRLSPTPPSSIRAYTP